MRTREDSLPLRSSAPVTFWLIAANVAVAAMGWFGDADALIQRWGLVPAAFGDAPLTLVTHAFLHGGLLHLALNLLMLGFLGRHLEPMMGSLRFAAVYAVGLVAAALAQVAWSPDSAVPMVGASGAISAALGAAVLLAPSTRIFLLTPFTLFIPVPMRLRTFGWVWAALQLVGLAVADPFGGGVAYMAHLGGFLAGLGAIEALRFSVRRRRDAARRAYQGRVHPVGRGPAPATGFRTYFVTDSSGRTYAFHESS